MKRYRMYYMNIVTGQEFFIEVNNTDEIQRELNKQSQYLLDKNNWEYFDQEEIK